MTRVKVQSRISPDIYVALERLAKANDLTVSAVIEELLVQALREQESELAASFLMPKLEDMLNGLMKKHVDRLAKLMARAAIESTIAAKLTLEQYEMLDRRYTGDVKKQLRADAWQEAFGSLKRNTAEAEALLNLVGES